MLFGTVLACIAAGLGAQVSAVAQASPAPAAPVLTVLHSFTGSDGSLPVAGVTLDAAGNIYGTTNFGGSGSAEFGDGTVFKLTSDGADQSTLTTLASFTGADGNQPQGVVVVRSSGHLFGTTSSGGADGKGTVFELAGSGDTTLKTLVSFTGANGSGPFSGLTLLHDCLYGTTSAGGAGNDGTVFELCGPGHKTLTTLVSFDGTNGSRPLAGLVADRAGNLYGTTVGGGANGSGTVFKLSGPHHETLSTLVNFAGTNGSGPRGGLAIDAYDNLFGTTEGGGAGQVGTLYELRGPSHETLTTLFAFSASGPGGTSPEDGLLIDSAGNLYGTTSGGVDSSPDELGSVFKLSADHVTLTTLYTFTGNGDGGNPVGGLAADPNGNLYGTTTSFGASGNGVVFKLTGSGFVPAR